MNKAAGGLMALASLGAIAVAIAEAACSSSSSSAGAPTVDAATGDTAAPEDDVTVPDGATPTPPTGDAGTPTVSLSWQIATQVPALGAGEPDAASDAGAPPVSGAKVCIYQMATIPCATTDATGHFTLTGLPLGSQLLMTVDKAGYRSVAEPIVTPGADAGVAEIAVTTGAIGMALVSDAAPPVGAAIDWTTTGQIQFFALGTGAITGVGPVGAPGTTVTMAPMSGVGPAFLTADNTFDASATTLIDVVGAFYNVAPGSYTLTMNGPGVDCEPITAPVTAYGYPGAAHQVTLPVIAGYTTTGGEYCGTTSVPGAGDAGDAAADGASDN
jgi:hypothetical protein